MPQLVCFIFFLVHFCIDYTQNTPGVKICLNRHAIGLAKLIFFCHKHWKLYFVEHKDENEFVFLYGNVFAASWIICFACVLRKDNYSFVPPIEYNRQSRNAFVTGIINGRNHDSSVCLLESHQTRFSSSSTVQGRTWNREFRKPRRRRRWELYQTKGFMGKKIAMHMQFTRVQYCGFSKYLDRMFFLFENWYLGDN